MGGRLGLGPAVPQHVAHDLHLRVIHHPDGVPPTEDPSAYEAYWREQARTTAGGMRRIDRLPGNVAHLAIGPVLTPVGPSWDAVTAAMALVADADALVLDVRECRGGDPDSVHFFERVGLDYVSCSPFRVPIARLEAGRSVSND